MKKGAVGGRGRKRAKGVGMGGLVLLFFGLSTTVPSGPSYLTGSSIFSTSLQISPNAQV